MRLLAKRRGACLLAVTLTACLPGSPRPPRPCPPDEPRPPVDPFPQAARPFLARYCVSCHGAEEPKAGVRLDRWVAGTDVALQPRLVEKVLRQLAAATMPPPEADLHPAGWERALAGAGLALTRATVLPPLDPGRVTLRRLNRAEYAATIRDLLGVHGPVADEFPPDEVGYGFDTVGDVLSVSPLHLERYLAAAERIAAEAIYPGQALALRREAEDLPQRGGAGRSRAGLARFNSTGGVGLELTVPWPGRYALRVRACGEQAGPEPVRLAWQEGARRLAEVSVPDPREAPAVHAVEVELGPGRHELELLFVNDYYRPEDPDPRQRDRNALMDWVEVEGPLDPPLPLFQRRYLTRLPGGPDEVGPLAEEVLRAFALRAFRRPARDEELRPLVALVAEACARGERFERGMQLALTAVLCSPSFLFREEPPAPAGAPGASAPLDPWALATRLSYFLWSSCPDERLLSRAASGRLAGELEAEARRLLLDARAGALVSGFVDQWLWLRELERVAPDPARFPGFDEALRRDLRLEVEWLFEAVLRENRSALELLDARYGFLNERLARHYGIPGVEGEQLRRVLLPPERRGLLGMGAVLTVTSTPTRTSPVRRGKWILEQLLDDPTPPPPPGAGALPPQADRAGAHDLRALLARHRADPSCASCHQRLDPLGLALEPYDAVGAWRSRDEGRPIDARATLPDGTELRGPIQLRAWLRRHGRDFVRSLARHLLTYALGRGPVPGDEPALETLLDALAPDYRLGDLVVALVRLPAFTSQRSAGTAPGAR